MTKDELMAKLRASGADAVSKIRSVPESAWDEGRYENGWNARQILAHVASIEWTYPKLIDVARATAGGDGTPAASPKPAQDAPSTASRSTPEPDARILSYNDRQVEKRAASTIDELLTEFETNRAATIAAVAALEDALLTVHIRSAGGITGTLGSVVDAVAVEHVRMHVADMVGETWTGGRF